MHNKYTAVSIILFCLLIVSCSSKNDKIITKSIGNNELLSKIYSQTGFYYCSKTNQLMLIKFDNNDEEIQNGISQEEGISLYTIIFGFDHEGKVIKKNCKSIPIESVKKFKSINSDIHNSFIFIKSNSMTYIDQYGNIFRKYNHKIANEKQLVTQLTIIFQKRFDSYLGNYYSDSYNKKYKLSKVNKKYLLEIEDDSKNIITDFFQFNTKASLLGEEKKYWISVGKEDDYLRITEYIDWSLYPEYDEVSECEHNRDNKSHNDNDKSYTIKQESVSFKLSDKR